MNSGQDIPVFGGYRGDEETYVDDQFCQNCRNYGYMCPMELPEENEEPEEYDRVMKRRKEDAIVRGGEPVWCIYWEGQKGSTGGMYR